VPLGQTYIGQDWTESFDNSGFFIPDQWKVTQTICEFGYRYDKLNP
jgi:hypothetical protein